MEARIVRTQKKTKNCKQRIYRQDYRIQLFHMFQTEAKYLFSKIKHLEFPRRRLTVPVRQHYLLSWILNWMFCTNVGIGIIGNTVQAVILLKYLCQRQITDNLLSYTTNSNLSRNWPP